jgi:SAM-dependent methyltransferase
MNPWKQSLRRSVSLAVLPLDYVSRALNDKRDFPPRELRRHVGPLRTFESSGAEFVAYLKLIAELKPGETFLDVGCGCGLIALSLKDYLAPSSRYVGLEIHAPAVAWCERHITLGHPNFHFLHSDVANAVYNAEGRTAAADYRFPEMTRGSDVILLKSVFTHMLAPEVDNYFAQIARALSRDGRCLATFFLLNAEQSRLAAAGANKLAFRFGDGISRHAFEHNPEHAVAYDEGHILGLLRKHGLALAKPIYYGHWSGREDGLSFQDLLLVRRAT